MKCSYKKCKNKAVASFTPDMDIRGIPFCKKHKYDVGVAYMMITSDNEEIKKQGLKLIK